VTTRTTRPLVAALVLALAACGGGSEEAAPFTTALLDDDGHTMPSAATDAATGVPRATAIQATDLERALGHDAIRADVDGKGAEAIKLAVQLVYAAQAAHDLPDSAPVLVRGSDLHGVRDVVQQLAAAGFSRIWIVDAAM
jgi:hypothetical protein